MCVVLSQEFAILHVLVSKYLKNFDYLVFLANFKSFNALFSLRHRRQRKAWITLKEMKALAFLSSLWVILTHLEELGEDTACAPNVGLLIVIIILKYNFWWPIIASEAHWRHGSFLVQWGLSFVDVALYRSSEPKVTDFDLATWSNEDVLRFEITVDYIRVVHKLKATQKVERYHDYLFFLDEGAGQIWKWVLKKLKDEEKLVHLLGLVDSFWQKCV
jgi:hypothetical protein